MDVASFFDLLDATEPRGREQVYTAHAVELSPEAVHEAIAARRPSAVWLAFRLPAGPPGEELPTIEEAWERLGAREGTIRDAYALTFAAPPFPPDAGIPVHTLLQDCALTGWRSVGGNLLTSWLAAWGALAGFAAGAAETCWPWLDFAIRQQDTPPGLEPLLPLARLRQHPELIESVHARRVVAGRWAGPPAVPELPSPQPGEAEISRGDWLRAVEALEDEELTQWAEEGLRNWDFRIARRLEERETIQRIRQAALQGSIEPPEVEALPVDLESWLIIALMREEMAATRLGALLAWRAGQLPASLLFNFVLGDLQEADLPLLIEHGPAELAGTFRELAALLPFVPSELRRDVLLLANPLHPKIMEVVGRLLPKLDILDALVTPERQWLRETIAWMRTLQSEVFAPPTDFDDLQRIIVGLLEHLPPAHQVTEEELKGAVAVAASDLSHDIEARAALYLEAPYERLVGAMLLRHRVEQTAQTEEQVAWMGALADLAVRAIMDIGNLRLFPLRLDLLPEVIAWAPSPAERVTARLALANTLSGLSAADPEGLQRALLLFEEALVEAEQVGDPDLYGNAAAMWARNLNLALDEVGQGEVLRNQALAVLDRALGLGLSPEIRSNALFSKAVMLAHPGPGLDGGQPLEAAELMEQAIQLSEEDDRWRYDMIRQMAMTWLEAGHAGRAEECLRRCLIEGKGHLLPEDEGLVLVELGKVLARRGAHAEAESLLREARRLTAATTDWGYSVIALIEVLMVRKRRQEALEWVRRLAADLDRVPASHHFDFWRLAMSLEGSEGDVQAAAAAREEALRLSRGSGREAVIHLLWAELDPTSQGALEIALAYVAGEAGITSPFADRMAGGLLAAHAEQLPGPTRAQLTAWSRERGLTFLEVALLDAAGDRQAALVRVDAALAEVPAEERVELRLLRLALLPPEAYEALRLDLDAILDELESLGDISLEGLCDYATRCHMAAAGEPGWLDRSIAAWSEAWARGGQSRRAAHIAIGWVAAVRSRVQAAELCSDPALAPQIEALTGALGSLDPAHLRTVFELIGLVLLSGSLTHPRLIEAAEQVLRALPDHPWTGDLAARIDSIRAAQEDPRVSVWGLPRELEARTPFNDQPDPWLVHVVAGRSPGAPPPELLEDPVPWMMVCEIRPDRADAVLAEALPSLEQASSDVQQALISAAVHVIQEAPFGEDVWPALWSAARQLPPTVTGWEMLLHHLGRARLYRDGETGEAGTAMVEDSTGMARFSAAVRDMDLSRLSTDPEESRRLKQAAIAELEVLLTEHQGTRFGGNIQVSLGNALRLEPDPDLTGALRCYAEVALLEERGIDVDSGKLHKVWADALIERGAEGDLLAAWEHAQKALQARRKGRLRAETLETAAHVARIHPRWDEPRRVRETASLLLEATRCAPSDMAPLLPGVLGSIAAWKQSTPASFDSAKVSSELLSRYPGHSEAIQAAVEGLTTDPLQAARQDPTTSQKLISFLHHPSGALYFSRQVALMEPALAFNMREAVQAMMRSTGRTSPPGIGADHLEERYIGDKPAALREMLTELETGSDEDRVGRLVLQVEVLARLARIGEGVVTTVRTATDAARQSIRESGLPVALGAFFLDRLAVTWGPDDHVSDPVLDFDLSVSLAREAVALLGGEDQAGRDLLLTLARSLRYRGGNAANPDLREARRLYERALEMDRRHGDASSVANTLHLLSDVVQYVGDGDRLSRQRQVIAYDREAVRLATNPHMKARYQGNLAWALTGLGSETTDMAEAEAAFVEAEELYEAALNVLVEPAHGNNVIQNRETMRAIRARRRGDGEGAIRIGRERLTRLGPETHPEVVAKAKHNLADALSFSKDPTQVEEALALFQEALAYRTPDRNMRQHWESAIGVAEALLRLLGLGAALSVHQFQEAIDALRSAADAGRQLGRGTELRRCAMDLARLARVSHRFDEASALGEEAWDWMREAMPYFLLDETAAEEEGQIALLHCFTLASLAADRGLVGALPGGSALSADRSAVVLRWWLRSEAAWRRLLRARLETPPSLGADEVLAWRHAISRRDAVAVLDRLRRIHALDPGWLTEDLDLQETRRWLTRHGALGIGVWPANTGFIVAVVGARPGDDRVLVLQADTPSLDEVALASELRDMEKRASLLDALVHWANSAFMERLRRFLGRPPKQVLWCPHGFLRLVPPSALLGSIPVSMTASLAIGPQMEARPRRDSAVVIVAEPEGAPMGTRIFQEAAALAEATSSRSRLIIGRGAVCGRALLPEAVDVHPTAEHVLREMDDAGLAVIIAHGHMEGLDDAWLHLLRPDGREDRLDVARLGQDPGAVMGLRVVLLSCETGRAGGAAHRPGGVAGALLAAGAREVVAPLWSVSVANALKVGRALLDGRREGHSFSEVLARVDHRTGEPGPQLGRVSPERRAAARWDVAAFVTWVG